MKHVISLALLASAMCLCTSSAQAQSPLPSMYMWHSDMSEWGNRPDPAVTAMVRVDVRYPTPANLSDPENAADAVVDQIVDRLNRTVNSVPSLTPGKVSILIQNFGHDDNWTAGVADTSLRFFRPENELPLPSDFSWPENPTSSDDAERASNTARHVWAYNANLKLWMDSFIAQYQLRQVQGAQANPPVIIPDPTRFHFDTEAAITGCCKRNYLAQLRIMAQSSQWHSAQVYGQPAGTTMKMLYDQARAAYHARRVNEPTLSAAWWPANLYSTGAIGELNPAQNHWDGPNVEYMTWYTPIARRAKDAMMRDAAYELIWTKWPNCKVSNYGDANTDNQPDTTGWFMEPIDNTPGQTRVKSSTFERGQIDTYGEGTRYWRQTTGRWAAMNGYHTGDFAAPHLYPAEDIRHTYPYYNSTIPFESPLQNTSNPSRNLYLPCDPIETYADTHLRLSRHWLESIINSGGGGNELTVAPWVPLVTLKDNGDPALQNHDFTYLVSPTHFQDFMAMVRGKNVPELMFWLDDFKINLNTLDAENVDPSAFSQYVLNETYDRVRRTYAWKAESFDAVGSEVLFGSIDPQSLNNSLREDEPPICIAADLEYSNYAMLRMQFAMQPGLEDYARGRYYDFYIEGEIPLSED